MGTYYELIKAKDPFIGGDFGVDEMSNKLTLIFSDPDEPLWKSIGEMTPEELAKVFLKGLTVCSYWMDAEKLENLILDHLNEIVK